MNVEASRASLIDRTNRVGFAPLDNIHISNKMSTLSLSLDNRQRVKTAGGNHRRNIISIASPILQQKNNNGYMSPRAS